MSIDFCFQFNIELAPSYGIWELNAAVEPSSMDTLLLWWYEPFLISYDFIKLKLKINYNYK